MTGVPILEALLAIAATLVIGWALLLAFLWLHRPGPPDRSASRSCSAAGQAIRPGSTCFGACWACSSVNA